MDRGGKKARTGFALATLAALAAAAPLAGASGLNLQSDYHGPASYAVATPPGTPGIFGIGVLTCDTGQLGDQDLAGPTGVYNGACWTVGVEHDNHAFQVIGSDQNFGGDVSLSVVFDYTGNGECQSGSCGVPAHARFSGCGAVTGFVPDDRQGTTVWVFVRAADVNPLTGRLCFASQGQLFGSF